MRARAKLHSADVDRAMRAELFYPGGHTGTAACSMWSASLLHIGARVVGSEGELRVLNPLSPQLYHRLSVKANGHSRRRAPFSSTDVRVPAGGLLCARC